jgi:hypothetical protein
MGNPKNSITRRITNAGENTDYLLNGGNEPTALITENIISI